MKNTFYLAYVFFFLQTASEDGESGPDLSTLRTFRVLRPLKLVSGVPSKSLLFKMNYSMHTVYFQILIGFKIYQQKNSDNRATKEQQLSSPSQETKSKRGKKREIIGIYVATKTFLSTGRINRLLETYLRNLPSHGAL